MEIRDRLMLRMLNRFMDDVFDKTSEIGDVNHLQMSVVFRDG